MLFPQIISTVFHGVTCKHIDGSISKDLREIFLKLNKIKEAWGFQWLKGQQDINIAFIRKVRSKYGSKKRKLFDSPFLAKLRDVVAIEPNLKVR